MGQGFFQYRWKEQWIEATQTRSQYARSIVRIQLPSVPKRVNEFLLGNWKKIVMGRIWPNHGRWAKDRAEIQLPLTKFDLWAFLTYWIVLWGAEDLRPDLPIAKTEPNHFVVSYLSAPWNQLPSTKFDLWAFLTYWIVLWGAEDLRLDLKFSEKRWQRQKIHSLRHKRQLTYHNHFWFLFNVHFERCG